MEIQTNSSYFYQEAYTPSQLVALNIIKSRRGPASYRTIQKMCRLRYLPTIRYHDGKKYCYLVYKDYIDKLIEKKETLKF